jgi:hypothetical protein
VAGVLQTAVAMSRQARDSFTEEATTRSLPWEPRISGAVDGADRKGIMITEAKEQEATTATAILPGPGANGQRTAAHAVGHLSFHRSVRAIRKRLRLSYPRGRARGRRPVAEEEGFSRTQA